jgi:hypothetical protein
MSHPRQVFLDPHGDNSAVEGTILVRDPVGFVRLALGDEPLHVQGQHLCEWAENYADGRGWRIRYLGSRVTELLAECPELSTEEAKEILDQIDRRGVPQPRPLRLYNVAMTLWDRPDLWNGVPTNFHAFRWLVWLAERNEPAFWLKLVRPLARRWQATAEPVFQRVYSARTPDEAWTLILEWLKVAPSAQRWPNVPESLPHDLKGRLDQDLRQQAVATDTDFFTELLGRGPELSILRAAAGACATVLRNNPEKASAERVRRLQGFLNHEDWCDLLTLVPPVNPGLPEWRFPCLEEWFVDKYLPYRLWASRMGKTPNSDSWVTDHAGEFARRFLEYYVAARAGGDGTDRLAWVRSSRLRSGSSDNIQLLIVLDGLAYPDAEELHRLIADESRRLSLDTASLALSALPTVTEFAKDAVAKGVAPADAEQTPEASIFTTVDDVIDAVCHAAPGDLIVWKEVQPDRSYHFPVHGSTSTVRDQVEAQLQRIARQIARVAEQIPNDRRLRVIVTTDHGRLLSPVSRARPAPPEMKVHGRAAWGSRTVSFDESGIHIEDGLAYLHPARFGLPPGQSYALILSEEAFLTSDERGGAEPYPHGGVFPEEVFVPWLEFSRDREPIHLNVTVQGEGEEGKPGTATLCIINTSAVGVRLTSLQIPALGLDVKLDGSDVGPYARHVMEIHFPRWPAKADANELAATLIYLLPDHRQESCEFHPELRVVSLYERGDDIIKDLGEF